MRKEYIKMIYKCCEQFERLLNNDEGVESVDDNLLLIEKCKCVLNEEANKKPWYECGNEASTLLRGLGRG